MLAFRRGEDAGQRVMWALGGLVSISLGVVLAIRPDLGAVTLATETICPIAYSGSQKTDDNHTNRPSPRG